MSIVYRNLRPEDYDEIIRIWTEAGLHVKQKGRDSKKRITVEMTTNPEYWIGVQDGDQLIGVVVGTYDGRRGCVNRLAVDKKHRRQGVAHELVRLCEERLKASGAMVVYALIEVENIPSQTFFKQIGYRYHDGIMYFSKRESDEA